MRLFRFVPVLLMLFAAAVCRADSMTYTFTYSGVSEFGGLSDPGSGSFTYTYTPGSSTGTLTTFSFTDTLQAQDGTKSTFDYSSANYSSIALGANGQIAQTFIGTNSMVGSNAMFGSVSFRLLYQMTDSSYTQSDTPGSIYYNDGNSNGSVVLTLMPNAATTPEPSSFALLGTGLSGVAGAMRQRFRARIGQ